MKKRIARKIVDPYGIHWGWYKSRSADLWQKAPLDYNRYRNACKSMHKKPYYDTEWYSMIKDLIIRNK